MTTLLFISLLLLIIVECIIISSKPLLDKISFIGSLVLTVVSIILITASLIIVPPTIKDYLDGKVEAKIDCTYKDSVLIKCDTTYVFK